jgi:hypothetical protein
MILKAKIELCPEVEQKIDKKSKIAGYIIIVIIMIVFAYVLAESFIKPPTKAIIPSKEEIKEYCENQNMIPDGYTISYKEEKLFWFIKNRVREQSYIHCKAEYPKEITEIPPKIPECCYPKECPQATNNPKNCNCIYLTTCIKIGEEYKQWSYKIIGTYV